MNKKVLWSIIGVVVVILIIVLAVMMKSPATTSDSMMTNTTQPTEVASSTDMNMQATTTASSTVSATVGADVSTGTTKTFTVEGSNFKFAPATLAVKKGDTVHIIFKNTGGFHDFRIDEFNVATKQISGGSQAEVTFVASKTGTFDYYCSVGNHRAMGMQGVLTVSQ